MARTRQAATDAAVDRLYGLPLEDFTRARDALAKELRQSGERASARDVRDLRKPSSAAWAVNQVARTQRRDLREFLRAGDAVRRAHEATLAGKRSSADLREATRKEREILDRLVDAARGLLSATGHSPSAQTIDRVRETFSSAVVDAETRSSVEAGRLTKERQAVGFGGLGPATPSRRPLRKGTDQRAARERKQLDGERKRLQRDIEASRRSVEAARRHLDHEQAELAERESELDAVDRRLSGT